MRVRGALWIGSVVAASAAVSAVALGQGSTWGGGTSAITAAADAAAPPPRSTLGSTASSDALDAGAPPAARRISTWGNGPDPEVIDASVESTPDAASPPRPAPAAPASADAGETAEDAGSYAPSNLGFSIGLHGGYALPFGYVSGLSLHDFVAQGMGVVGVDLGWYFSPHLYIGAYFTYGIGVGVGLNNDTCGDVDTECSATQARLGALVRWHFLPLETWDPWVGAGLGYELVQITATSDVDNSSVNATSPLQGIDVSLQLGVDYKPLRYLGIGPYVEVATGSYLAGVSGFDVHGWATMGARFRMNVF